MGLGTATVRAGVAVVTVMALCWVSWRLAPDLGTDRASPAAAVADAVADAPDATPAAWPAVQPGAPAIPGAAAALPFESSYGGGEKQRYLAYLPARRSTRMAVVLVHGGGWINGSAMATQELNRRLHDAGVASFSVEYRLAPGARWPAQRADLAAALRVIQQRAVGWGVDPERIGMIGMSAGGHLALDLADTAGSSATCAVVAYSAPTSMALLLRGSRGDASQRSLARAVRQLAPTAAARRDATLPRTPSAGDAPALLFAGAREWLDPRHSTRFAAGYAGLPVEVVSVVLPGETRHTGYAVHDPTVWSRSLQFLEKYC